MLLIFVYTNIIKLKCMKLEKRKMFFFTSNFTVKFYISKYWNITLREPLEENGRLTM